MQDIPLTDSEGYIDPVTGEVLSDGSEAVSCPEGVDPILWDTWIHKTKSDPVLAQFERAIKGQNIGLANGLKHINNYIYGIQQGRYYLVGADSGVGKTTMGDFMFVIMAWLDAKKQGRRFKVFYCSFEIGRMDKIYRWASIFIFIRFQISLSADYLQGRIPHNLPSKEHQRLFLIAYQDVLELLKDVYLVNDVMSPLAVFEEVVEVYETLGTVLRNSPTDEEKKLKKKGSVKGFIANDPLMVIELVIDHMALTEGENTKQTMDRLSKYGVALRNMFGTTIVVIQQFSTDLMATARNLMGTKQKEENIAPQRIDFGDSKATFRDADVVFGLIKPGLNVASFMNYDVSVDGLSCYMLACYLMKNRQGPSHKISPLFVNPIAGYLYDLPQERDNFTMQEWYDYAKKLDQICQVFSHKEK